MKKSPSEEKKRNMFETIAVLVHNKKTNAQYSFDSETASSPQSAVLVNCKSSGCFKFPAIIC